MTRKKVKLAWIVDDNARRASLKKRRLGLLKKVSELATLCGVKAGVVIYSPDENEPVVWPSYAEVQQLLVSFHNMPALERLKKMTNQEIFLKERITKGLEHQMKYQRRNKEVEMGHLMHQVNQGKRIDEHNLNELQGLIWFVEEKMKEIRKRSRFFQQVPFAPIRGPDHEGLSFPPQGVADNLMARIDNANAVFGGDGRTPTDSLPWDQWFIDMMNNNELKSAASSGSIRSNMGLPYQPFATSVVDNLGLPGHYFGGSSGVAADMRLSQFRNFRGPKSNMGLPPLNFRSYAGATDMVLTRESVGGKTLGPFGSDRGLRLHPFGHVGSSSNRSESEGLPFGLFGGSDNSGAGIDMGLPFEEKSWPNNFST